MSALIDSPCSNASIDDLVAHAQALFMRWHQGIREERDRRLKDLHRQNLQAAGRAVYRFEIYDELLKREVKERIKIYNAVADKYGAVELLSKSRLDAFREVIMTTVTWGCTALRDHNEMDFRAVGDPGPFPEPNRYESLKGIILGVVNTELDVLETEGRLRGRALPRPQPEADHSGNHAKFSGGESVRAKPGPKPDRETATLVRDTVRRVAGADPWKTKLDEICEALDEAQIACPKTWRNRDPAIRSWTDAAVTERQLAVKNIEYRLETVPP